MANFELRGIVATMPTSELVFVILNIVFSFVFLLWIGSMISWINRGMVVPRYVHILAGVLVLVGMGVLVFSVIGGFFSWPLGLGCIAVPAPFVYFGWLWMFGPEFDKSRS